MSSGNSSTTTMKHRRSRRNLGLEDKALLISSSEDKWTSTSRVRHKRSSRFSTTDEKGIESSKSEQLMSTPKKGGKKRRNARGENFRAPLTSIENDTSFHLQNEEITPNKGNAQASTSSKDPKRNSSEGHSIISPLMISRASGEKKSKNINKGIQVSGADSCLQGWTKDQESALQRAYFTAMPSPHFWKNVAKMVPEKSAQECFDKVHADCITPPQPWPRSRAKKANSSPLRHFSLSAIKLLEPPKLDSKMPRKSKQKKYVANKTTRHLLQKHTEAEQGYEADAFSTLEPAMNSSSQLLNENSLLDEYQERSLSTHKKPSLSKYGDSCPTALVSPPVLKQIKNRALHEKYIDQLQCREARRTAGDRWNFTSTEDKTDGNVQTMDVVTVAKNALVSDARDIIHQFQQANPTSKYDDFSDDDDGPSGEDGGEDEP